MNLRYPKLVSTSVTSEMHRLVANEAAANRIPQAEMLRRILAAHFRNKFGPLLQTDLQTGRAGSAVGIGNSAINRAT